MRAIAIFLLAAAGTWIIDQSVKELFLSGYEWQSRCISLELHMNRGVAFSLFASLGIWLKWLQLFMILALGIFAAYEGWLKRYPLSMGLLAGGAFGNLYDRFAHGAVVDYVYWHCGFDFAVFNYADVMIDLGIGLILFMEFLRHRKSTL